MDIDSADVSNKNIDGLKATNIAKPITDLIENGDGNTKPSDEKEEIPLPSRQPQFPGGEAAWIAFLKRYLQAPEDLEPGQRVEVVVQFWVDVDGSVSRTSVMKSGGSSFDKEVLRVIKKMPKWEPALQHGNPVAVPYSQPVTFMGVEQ
jgi:protein TonB